MINFTDFSNTKSTDYFLVRKGKKIKKNYKIIKT